MALSLPGGTDIREEILFALTGSSSAVTASYMDPYNSYDFAIGGIPFLSGISMDNPGIIKSADFRKQQVDQSSEPGEQSLTGWWARSQLSFHGGAGLKYSDPALDSSAPFRYLDSEGLDVWTQGQVTLLPQSQRVLTLGGTDPVVMVGAKVLGTDLVVYGNTLATGYVTAAGTTGTVTSGTAPASPWQAITSDGNSFYLANKDGVWQLTWTAFPATYTFVKLWTYTGVTSVSLGWVKGRLMGGADAKLYELVPPAGSPPFAAPTTPVYTSTVPGFHWSSITAGPEAIYAAGFSGNRGSILKVAVDTQGALPVLSGATEVAQLPTGEYPNTIRAYLGTLLVIGTNRGVRVADIENGGAISYGPLIETPGPVNDLVSSDRFAYATWTNNTAGQKCGLVRLDLSLKFDDGKYAWAKDLLTTGVGTVQATAMIGETNRVAFTVNGSGVWFASATDLEPTGFMRTAATRYNTLWPKLFKRLAVRAIIQGGLVVQTVDQNGNVAPIAVLDDNSDLTQDLAINAPDTPQENLALLLTFNRKDATHGTVFRGYQLKATPGGPRQYLYNIPVMCFDSEKDGDGNVMGYPGYAYERLKAIMGIASAGSVVLYEDLLSGSSVLITIEDLEFRQTAPGGSAQSQWGGVLTLSMRTLE